MFFVAGGAVNARSWRTTRDPYASWLWRRVARPIGQEHAIGLAGQDIGLEPRDEPEQLVVAAA